MSDIKNLLASEKNAINIHIENVIEHYKNTLPVVNPRIEDTLTRLKTFAQGGKGVRGALLVFAAQMYGYKNKNNVLDIAAVLEILHSSLLIHDDIMDNDTLRRGQPSVYAQYIPQGENIMAEDPLHFARSMGICVGDVGFFMGLDISNSVLSKLSKNASVFSHLCNEFTMVGLAQMDDVYFSHLRGMPSIDDILYVYTYKTARYTFSLPFTLGAMIAEAPQDEITKLEKIGEHLGIVFQIRDDEIGLFSTEKEIGKPVGSDIRENKKTLIRALLYSALSTQEQKELDTIFTDHDITDKDFMILKKYLADFHIMEKVNEMVQKHERQAKKLIHSLYIENNQKLFLKELIEFASKRTS